MAISRCSCGSTNFELKEVVPRGSNFKLHFVQCTSCGIPVGVIEYMNISDMLQKQNEAIKRIASAVGIQVDL
jgi:hypothetical protein